MFTFLPKPVLQIRHDHVVLEQRPTWSDFAAVALPGGAGLRRGYPRFPLKETVYSRMTYGPRDAKDLNFVMRQPNGFEMRRVELWPAARIQDTVRLTEILI